jgi:hypothetical protein
MRPIPGSIGLRRIRRIAAVLVMGILCAAVLLPQETGDSEASPAPSAADESEEEFPSFLSDPFAAPSDTAESSGELDLLDPFGDDGEDAIDESEETDDAGEIDVFALDDLDKLFESGDMIEEADESATAEDAAPQDQFLVTEKVEWGGNFRGTLGMSWTWNDLWTPGFDITAYSASLSPTVSSSLYFDARPKNTFRVFGKMKIATGSAADSFLSGIDLTDLGNVDLTALIFPQPAQPAQTADGSDDQPPSDEDTDPGTPGDYDPDADLDPVVDEETDESEEQEGSGTPLFEQPTSLTLSIPELFADFSWEDKLFFRFGKHTIKWGVGYFWSPADVLNLTPIDTEDPTADREGPISLKVHLPFQVHNAYFYLISNNADEPLDLALAPKFEFVVGNTELGIGAFYQRRLAPRAIAMFSTSIRDVDIFGEGIVSYGSDRIFVRRAADQSRATSDRDDDLETVLETYTEDSRPFFSGTIGLIYLNMDKNINLYGQYLFNGEGYKNSSLLEPAYYLLQNPDSNGLAIPDGEERPDDYEDPPALSVGDVTNFGRHYAAMGINFNEIGDTALSITTFGLVNFNDLSGIFSPSLSVKIFDYITINFGIRMTFGEPGDEYTDPTALLGVGDGDGSGGPLISITLDVSMGGGSF